MAGKAHKHGTPAARPAHAAAPAAAAAAPAAAPLPVTSLEQLTTLENNLVKIKDAIAALEKSSETLLSDAMKTAANPNFQVTQLRSFIDAAYTAAIQGSTLQALADEIEKQLPELRRKLKDELKAKVEKELEELNKKIAELQAKFDELNN